MATVKSLRKELMEKIAEIELPIQLEAMLKVAESYEANEDEEPDMEDGEEDEPKPKRGKLKAAAEEDEDEDENNDDEEEDEPVKKSTKKTVKSAKPAKTEKKSVKKAAAAPVKLTPETANYSEISAAEVKEMVEVMDLNLKKAKVSKDADVRKLLTQIQKASKKALSGYEKMAAKAGVEIKQPRGRTTEEKKSRVAIVQLLNAGVSPFK